MNIPAVFQRVGSAIRQSRELRSLGETLTVFIVASASGAVIVLAARGVADVGDMLGFLGAAVGAFLAVAGAVWVENWKRADVERHKYDNMRRAVVSFWDRFEEDTLEEIEDPEDLKASVSLTIDYIQSMIEYVQRTSLAIDDIDVLRFTNWFKIELNKSEHKLQIIWDEIDQGSGIGHRLELYRSQYRILAPSMRTLVRSINSIQNQKFISNDARNP